MWQRRWFRRLVIAAGVTPVLVALLGFLVAPPVVRRVAEKQLTELLGRRVTVGRVRINPFALSLTIEGLQVFEADGITPFVGFSRLYVNAEAASIYRRGPVVREVRLESPRLRVVRLASAEGPGPLPGYNFSDIVARLTAPSKTPTPAPPPSPQPEGGPPPRFSLNNLRLIDGEATFDDRALGGSHRISELNVGVPFVSTLPVYVDTFVEPGLKVRIDGAPFAVGGRSKPFKDSLETTLELRLTDLDVTRLVPYSPVPLGFDVASASLNVAVDASFVRPRSGAPAVTLKGRVALDHLDVRHRSGAPLLSWKELEVVMGSAQLAAQRFTVERVALDGLEVHARRLANGSFDLEKVLPASDGKKSVKDEPSGPAPRFEVRQLRVINAALHLRDETVRPALNLAVDQIALAVTGLSNAPGARAQVNLGLRATPGGTFEHQGTLSLAPLAATGTLKLTGLEPGRFAPYYRDQILFDVTSGRLAVGASYRFEAPPRGDPIVNLSDAHLELSDLALHRRAAPVREDFLRLGILVVKGGSLDLARRSVRVEQISSRDGKLRAARDAAGNVDLAALTPPPRTPAPPAPAAPGPAWTVELAHLELDRWGARFQDAAVKPEATVEISPIAIKVDGFSTAPRSRATLDVRLGLNKQGRLGVTGSASLDPLAADLRLDLKSLEILPLQPYFADQVTLTVTDGTVSLKGQAKLATATTPAPARAGTAAATRFDFNGDIDVQSFASLDGSDREPLVGWKLLHVGGLALSTEPVKVTIGEVALTDLQSRVVLSPDARLNLEDLVVASKEPTPAPAPAPAAPAPPAPVTVGKVTLAGGKVSFTDRSVRPGYTTELTDLAAKISGLSSDASTQADLDVHGSLDHAGDLSIAGKVNPLAKELFVDLKVDLKGVELPPASPYAGKYAGYGISKGKLGLSLDYHIEKSRLDAKNRLFIDQFSFGDKVPSPDATKLPVRLAVALLKDRHGVIDIDLPIAGSLEDPQFKVWGAIWKVLGNLIAKAATAPFSLIASAFGGGDQLSHLDFPAGQPALDGSAPGKILTLGRVLRERPGLSFEIEGRADPARDREGLRRTLHERKLRAQRALELAKAGTAVSSPDDVRLDPADRARLVEKAYAAETFEKPKNVLGIAKGLPTAEMEKLMLAHTEVGEDALRELAQQRAVAVQAALQRAEPGAASRLFLVPPKVEKGGGAELRLRSD